MSRFRIFRILPGVGIAAILSMFTVAGAAEDGVSRRPFGGYCQEGRGGDYGARTPVPTVEDARRILLRYYAGTKQRVGPLTEHSHHFRAQILDAGARLIDVVIIDRHTGRIRSIY